MPEPAGRRNSGQRRPDCVADRQRLCYNVGMRLRRGSAEPADKRKSDLRESAEREA